jgi:hypothetical protein
MKVSKVAASAAVGLGIVAAGLVAPVEADAASRCTGASGYWTCYSTTTGPAYATSVVKSWPIRNTSPRKITASCRLTSNVTFSSSSSQTVSVTSKVELYKVAELTVAGTQERVNTLTVSESTSLAASFVLNPGESATCKLTHGYYRVGTRYQRYSNYKVVEDKRGTTTVPYEWGLDVA